MYQQHLSLLWRISLLSTASLFAAGAAAQVGKSDKEARPAEKAPVRQTMAETAPVYKPPVRGAPTSRVGGGSRSVGSEMPRVYVLTPQDVGFTSKDQTDLFWFVSGVTPAKVLLTIYVDSPEKPLLEQSLAAVSAPGIQRVRLSAFNLVFKPRVDYRWRITLIDNSNPRAARTLAGGAIQRVDISANLLARLNNVDHIERARIYAEEGLWYDAIEQISDSIDAAPSNRILRRNRAGLLSQVGLTEPSVYDAEQK